MTYSWGISRFGSLPLFAALLIGMGLLILPAQTFAQSSSEGPPTLVKHLRSELQAKDPMQRQMALIDITTLAHCTASCNVSLRSVQDKQVRIDNETGIGTMVELDALVPDLLKSYRQGPADGHRLLAMAALLQIGNERGLEQLIDEGASQSPDVEKATQRGLAAFYMEKYPELMDRSMRTNRLSLDDIEEVKAFRLKKAKMEAKGKG